MEPVMVAQPFDHDDFLYQIKWDGVRLLTYREKDDIALFSRRQNLRTHTYPELVEQLAPLPGGTVLDGEVIALKDGKPNFSRVLKRDLRKSKGTSNIPVHYMVFDILAYKGKPLLDMPLTKRLALLSKILPQTDTIQLVDTVPKTGKALFTAAEKNGLEGIVAKRAQSTYTPGKKTDDWQKAKVWRTLSATIGGVNIGARTSVCLGLPQRGSKLRYLGNAGAGKLGEEAWQTLLSFLASRKANTNPFDSDDLPKTTVFCQPQIVVQVRYFEKNDNFHLRHPTITAIENISEA